MEWDRLAQNKEVLHKRDSCREAPKEMRVEKVARRKEKRSKEKAEKGDQRENGMKGVF